MNRLEAVSHKGLAYGFDNGNSARHGRLIEDWHTIFCGELENLMPVLGEEGLVSGDDDLASGDGFFDEGQRDIDTAHELHHDMNRRIGQQLVGRVCEKLRRRLHIARLREVAHSDLAHLKLNTNPLLQKSGIAEEVFINPSSNRSKPCQSYADSLSH